MSDPSNIHVQFSLKRVEFILDVGLQLSGQGVTALFGASGSGKTTVLRCMAGLIRARGRMLVADEVWQDDALDRFLPPYHRALGYVFQEPSLFVHLNVLRNIEYGLRRTGVPKDRRWLEQAVDLLGIGHLLDRMPNQLSGGEQQRVGIVRALSSRPRLLLMDEPLAALDHARKAEILPFLDSMRRELAIPIIYVSHAIEEVAHLADHVVVMEEGRVLASGSVNEVFARTDLTLAHGDDAGVILDVTLTTQDSAWQLSGLRFAGGVLWLKHIERSLGTGLRVRVLARDVSIALTEHRDTSILNSLPAQVVESLADTHPAQILVKLNAGGAVLMARITRRSADILQLKPGMQVWAQVKSVALMN